jgi:hypothetical protein
MNWGNLKWQLNQLTPEQLNEDALVYHPHFDRVFEIGAMDDLQNFRSSGDKKLLVLGLKNEPKHD